MSKTILRTGIAVTTLLVGLFSTSYAQTITTFDVPSSTSTIATAINPAGRITGSYFSTTDFVAHGFLRKADGSFTSFDAPGAASGGRSQGTFPTGIDPAGEITGTYVEYVDGKFVSHGFLRGRDGTITMFDVPGSNGTTTVVAINPAGRITGFYFDETDHESHGFLRKADGTLTTFVGSPTGIDPAGQITGLTGTHSFLRKTDGTITTFDVPGSTYTAAAAINPAGQITGTYVTDFVAHGFLRKADGTITTFDVPGSAFTLPTAINPAGQITGMWDEANGVSHGFLRTNGGRYATFDVTGSSYFHPDAINPAGQITGFWDDVYGFSHGFLRSP